MVLTRDELEAIARKIGADQAAPIIHALEKLDREQKIEVKRDLLMELATKADIARLEGRIEGLEGHIDGLEGRINGLEGQLRAEINGLEGVLRGEIKRVEVELKSEIKRLELFMKVLIGLAIIGMAFFSPNAAELIRLLK